MKIKEMINALEKLEQEYGNVNINIYLSYTKEDRRPDEPVYDEGTNDVYIGVYA